MQETFLHLHIGLDFKLCWLIQNDELKIAMLLFITVELYRVSFFLYMAEK